MHDRLHLRATFETAAAHYHHARPRYPDELFDELQAFAFPHGPADIVEIGPATGIATIPLALRGHRVTAVELGPELAAVARVNLAEFDEVTVVNASFDEWEPPEWGAADAVVAATAWHWLDPATKYERAHRHLRPGGTLAFWTATHVVPPDGDPFFADIQDVYCDIGEARDRDHVFPRPGELPTSADEIGASGLFDEPTVHHIDWEIVYDADGYLALLDTFSSHIAMEPSKRRHLHAEIRRRLAQRPDGLLRRHWGAVLHLARRSG